MLILFTGKSRVSCRFLQEPPNQALAADSARFETGLAKPKWHENRTVRIDISCCGR